MKIKRSNVLFIFLLLLILFPLSVYADVISVTNRTTCPAVTDDVINMGINENLKNDDSETEGSGGGMYLSAEQDLGLWWGNKNLNIPSEQQGKRIKAYYYVVGRLDAWSNTAKNWTKTLKDKTYEICPKMNLTYTADVTINGISDYTNVKVLNISTIDFSNNSTYNFFGKSNHKKITDYSVKNLSVTNPTGNSFSISNGSKVKYQVKINNLQANTANGLGFNGTNNHLCALKADGTCSGVARALHYLVPIQVEIEFDNPDYEPNPCVEPDAETAQKYAYDNPGKCCWEYPETCCKNEEHISLIQKTRNDVVNFCCNKYSPKAYYGISFTYGLPQLPTFKSYYNDFTTNDIVNALCNCNNSNDYYVYTNASGEPEQSYCCQHGPLKDNAGIRDGKCKIEYTCDNPTYLSSHISECCSGANYYKYKGYCPIADQKWKASFSGASCKSNPSSSSSFGENSVATGQTTNGTITESISFSNYNLLDYMKQHTILAGTGFDYGVTVKHGVVRRAKNYYSYCSGYPAVGSLYGTALNQTIATVTAITNIPSNEKDAKIRPVSSKWKFITASKNDKYVLKEGTDISNYRIINSYSGVGFNYKVPKTCTAKDGSTYDCSYCEGSVVNIPYQITYEYEYDIELENKYIEKSTGKIDTNKDLNINYLNGGNKFYPEKKTGDIYDFNIETGIYDFNIKLDTENYDDLGVTEYLLNNEEGFKCQYGVANKIKKDGDFTTGTDPLPVPGGVGKGYYFRQISLSTPFPNNRVIGSNWNKYCSSGTNCSYITKSGEHDSYGSEGDSKGAEVYRQEPPMYKITLDSNIISQIKYYNKSKDYDYGWINMSDHAYNALDSTSNFLSGKGTESCDNCINSPDPDNCDCDYIDWKENTNVNDKADEERRNKVGDF